MFHPSDDAGVLDKKLFYSENGLSDCMNACHDVPTCESFNLAESKPGEWYCELTALRPTDTAYAVPQEHDNFDNYSFTVSSYSFFAFFRDKTFPRDYSL